MDLVTGATGVAGSQVVRALIARGQDVRAFVRDRDRALDLFGEDADVAVGDFADSDSVRAALVGVDRVVLSGPDDPRRVEWEKSVIDAAAAERVRRVVKLSSIVTAPDSPVAFWAWHAEIEQHLLDSGLPATLVRSAPYMSNVLSGVEQVAREGRLYAPAGEARMALIHPRDVGAAVAAALTTPGHEGRTHVITGPEAIGYRDVAAELARVLGRPVRYVDVPDEVATEALVDAGLPGFAAQHVVNVFGELRRGVAQTPTSTVEHLTGRAPAGFAAFAREHAGEFEPATAGAQR